MPKPKAHFVLPAMTTIPLLLVSTWSYFGKEKKRGRLKFGRPVLWANANVSFAMPTPYLPVGEAFVSILKEITDS